MNTMVITRSARLDDLLLLVGQTLSQVSDRMVQLGLIWFITSSFGEGFLIWYLVIGGLPHALLVKHASLAITRFGALKTVLFSDLIRGFIYLFSFCLVLLFPGLLSTESGSKVLWLLFISVFTSNIFSAFFNPAILSLAVEIKKADAIQKLTAKLSTVTSFATILGPVLGLFAFSKFGLSGLFAITGVSYLVSAYALSLVTKTNSAKAAAAEPSSNPALSLDFLKSQMIIAIMLAVFLLMNLLLSPLQVLMPSMAKDLFGNSFNSLAILETVVGVGILLGGALLSFISIHSRPLFWTWVFLVLLSFGFLGFTFSGAVGDGNYSFLAASAGLFVMGFSLGVANVLIINILQTQPKASDVPKVMSLVNLISTAALPFSLALLGFLQRSISIVQLGRICGVLLVVFVFFSFFTFRRYGKEIFK